GSIERYLDFGAAPGVTAPQTWQVPRAAFDDLLLRHAAASGADVREGQRVIDLAFDADGVAAALQATDGSSPPHALRARAVVDASGRGAILGRKFGLRVDEPRLANVAVFSHYAGVPRPDGRRAGDIRIVARDDLGWFWLIPISAALTSVGVVLPRGGAGDRGRARARRSVGAAVPPLRAAPASALPVVPPLRDRLLHAGVPRSVLRRGSARADVSRARDGVRRLLAAVARHARV